MMRNTKDNKDNENGSETMKTTLPTNKLRYAIADLTSTIERAQFLGDGHKVADSIARRFVLVAELNRRPRS